MKYTVNYTMEELVPVVTKLARKYTCGESTSISYDKLEALMNAVTYCIQEAQSQTLNTVAAAKKPSPQEIYDIGNKLVLEKTRQALNLYNDVIIPSFQSYKVTCLDDTVLRGIPKFFRYYDAKFAPHRTILSPDYPVLKDLSGYCGIDKIYEYLLCIDLEKSFLEKFAPDHILRLLGKYCCAANIPLSDLMENITEIVLMNVLCCLLAKRPMSDAPFTDDEYAHVEELLLNTEETVLKERLTDILSAFLRACYPDKPGLSAYLLPCVKDAVFRLKNAAVNGRLSDLYGLL